MQNVEIYLPYCSNQGTAIKILQSLREKNVVLGSTLIVRVQSSRLLCAPSATDADPLFFSNP
jgi:hypothetical protein